MLKIITHKESNLLCLNHQNKLLTKETTANALVNIITYVLEETN